MQLKLSGADVVLVEDDTDVRGILREFLTSIGYRVRVAADGQQALSLLAQAIPDVVLTDLNMPNMDGWELLRVLAADSVLKHIPVGIMTAEETSPSGYTVFRKPFRMDALIGFLEASCSTAADLPVAHSSKAKANDAED